MAERSPISIEHELSRAWRSQRNFVHLRGLATCTIWTACLLLVDFAIDWGIFSPNRMASGWSVLLLIANVIVLSWVIWKEWLRYLSPFDQLHVALNVEQYYPNLSSLLVSYTQLQSPHSQQPDVSMELVEAMRDQAVAQSAGIDFRKIVDFGQLRDLALVAGGMLLFFSGLGFGFPGHVGALFQRLTGSPTAYPTRTRIVKVECRQTVRMGDPANVLVSAEGVVPNEGSLWVRRIGERWKRLPLAREANSSRFLRTIKELSDDCEFYVQLGDARTDPQPIRVVPAPRLTSARVQLRFPDYVSRDSVETDQLQLEVVEGTELNWELRCNSPVERLRVRFEEEWVEADVSENGKTLSFSWSAKKAVKYSFRWTEGVSGENFEYDDVQYGIRVVRDERPEVDLLAPTENGLATTKKKLALTARARDDFGLAEAWLVYSIDGSEENRIPIENFAAATTGEVRYTWLLRDHIPSLSPGVNVSVAVEVSDFHPDARGHTTRSATRQLSIVQEDQYIKWYFAELAAQRDEVQKAIESERTSSKEIKQIRVQEGESE